ncbi:MAG: hypothetical protein MUF64_03980 [Polyangiaceae bacterium]|jgi:tRNA G18 (ribose-2'-O)-methylase SpoU|nr:hypothetical protein [Polyangiaceae bacterium]
MRLDGAVEAREDLGAVDLGSAGDELRRIDQVAGGAGVREQGMHHLEEVHRLPDVEAFFERVQGRPVWALEREFSRRSLYEARSFPQDVVLAFGSERHCFPPGFLPRCDDVLAIPLYSVNNSLPVAVAAGITLSWWAHRRYAPGTVITPGR